MNSTQGGPPLVSVCMPAFNAERFLEAALRSVLSQTYENLEILVLDDCSTDRTHEVARSFSDRRLRVWKAERNLGGFQATNRLISLAAGRFLATYHADDVYEPTIVEREQAFLGAHPEVGAVFTLDHNIDENGTLIRTVSMPAELAGKDSLDYDTVFRYQVRKGNPFCCPTFMTRREVLDAVGVFEPEAWDIAADLELWIRIARRFPLAILNAPLVRYRKGSHQWTARHRRLRIDPDMFFKVMDEWIARDRWADRLSADELTEYECRRCDDDTYRAANWILKGDPVAARTVLSARSFPWRTLRVGVTRRKLRLLALRAAIFAGLIAHATPPLSRVLQRIGP